MDLSILQDRFPRAFSFEVASLFPGRRFRRLVGRPGQSPEINTGEPVGDRVTLPVHDALFLAAT